MVHGARESALGLGTVSEWRDAAPKAARDAAADWARSGVVALTGHRAGAPLIPPGSGATWARVMADRIAVASDVQLDGPALLAERAAFTRHTRQGTIAPGGHTRLLRTADGWAAVSCARPDDPPLLEALIGAELPADPWPTLARWLAGHPGGELAERAVLLGVAAAPVRPVAPATFPALPARGVAGLLVVDFSALWAGPLCAHVLGLAGARVVKVETPQRPDGSRRGNAGFYQLLHAGHHSVVLDPGDPVDRRRLAELVRAADVVVEASRPRALRRMGLVAEDEVARGATWVSITAAGRASDRVGFGDDVAASAGLVADAGGAPVFCGDAIADPLAGLTAAALAMSAPTDATGMLWDVPMAGVVAATLDGSCGGPARRDRPGWVVDTPGGSEPVAAPRARAPAGEAASSGTDTEVVLGELGIR